MTRRGIFVYVVERVNRETWAVVYFGPDGRKAVHMTLSQIEAERFAEECQRAFDTGFEAGLIAQKYNPVMVRRLILEEA